MKANTLQTKGNWAVTGIWPKKLIDFLNSPHWV